MADLPFIALALVGATLIVVRSVIMRPLRRIYPTMLECSQCVGWWFGATAAGFGLLPPVHGKIPSILVGGAAISFLAMLADSILLNLLGDPHGKKD